MKKPWWHWSRNPDAWNDFCTIYGNSELAWGASEDAWGDDGIEEQLWAIQEGLAEEPRP